MDNRDLTNFLALAKTLHFARAATAVHISPSALTRAIQRLEDEVGDPLFYRDRRTVRLTESGKLFLNYAEDAILSLKQFQNRIRSQGEEIGGSLSIYSSVTASYSILQDILPVFREHHPNIQIKLATGDVADAIDKVAGGDFDCSIAASPNRLPNGVEFLNLVTTPLIFIAPINIPNVLFFNDSGTVDWGKTFVIISQRDLSRERLNAWFKAANILPKIFAEVAGNEAIIAMVSLGFGIGVVPEIVLQNSPMINKVKVLEVSPPLAPYSVGIAYNKREDNRKVLEAFKDVARDCFL